MNIFNSLGSNYNLDFVVRSLFTIGSKKNHTELKRFLEKKYEGQATLVYKGREAIEMALLKCELPPKSKVLITGFTCYAVYGAVVNAGHIVVYADVDDGLNFSAQTLKKIIDSDPSIRVVIVQNTLGFPCQMNEIDTICKKNNLILIEDLAHSIGAEYDNKKEAGTVGDFTTLSFSQDKMIDAVSGGALIVRSKKYQKESNFVLQDIPFDQRLKDRFYPLFTYLIRKTYGIGLGKGIHLLLKRLSLLSMPMAGGEKGIFRTMTGWHCVLALSCFKKLTADLRNRREIASAYFETLDTSILPKISTKSVENGSNLRFYVEVDNRADLIKYLKKEGIYVSDIWYDAPVAPKKYLDQTSYVHQCPISEKTAAHILNLPNHKSLSVMQAKEIAKKINLWLQLQHEK